MAQTAETNLYTPPMILINSHAETIYPAMFRHVSLRPYERERIRTWDEDFLDLDWLRQASDKLVIISHGLEGNTSRAYIKGMARAFYNKGYDVLTWNYRGCSEEMNKAMRFYHSGATDDLDWVLSYAAPAYEKISLIGFSLGGNITLKYLGEKGAQLNSKLTSACAISVPMDLYSSCLKISSIGNWIYSRRFLKSLKGKVRSKAAFQTSMNIEGLDKISTLMDFDDHYTAPLHGFKNALDYYKQCSSLFFLDKIIVPTLIINALNDPFLTPQCFPDLSQHPHILFETPSFGGHVGFARIGSPLYWSERRTLEFIKEY